MVHTQAVQGLSFARSVVRAFHCQAVPGIVALTVDRAQPTTDNRTTPRVCVSSSHLSQPCPAATHGSDTVTVQLSVVALDL